MSISKISHTATVLALLLSLGACGKQDTESTSIPAGNAPANVTLADCEKLPNPAPKDESAASKAAAVSEGAAARMTCKKTAEASAEKNADLARIREIKEQEVAERASRKVSEEEWGKKVKEGGKAPVKDFKY